MTRTFTREDLQRLADGPIINPVGGFQGERRNPVTGQRRKPTQARGYIMSPGTGPEGETCKSCKHIRRVRSGSRKTFRKCGLNEHNWTHGPGSDIKAGSPACRSWAKPEEQK